MIRWLGALVVCSGVGLAGGGGAEPITLGGLTFSDELGGVRLERGWGSGSLDDPIVLVEEITGDGPAILIVRGMTHRFGNRIRSHHEVGFALTKLVRNGTGQPWSLFSLELREFLEQASPFGDGLSFAQASDAGRPFRSDRFAETIETREPFDGVQFVDGLVEPGETVALSFVVTDTTPRWEFYLLQKRDSPLASMAPPAPARPGLVERRPRRAASSAVRLEVPRELSRKCQQTGAFYALRGPSPCSRRPVGLPLLEGMAIAIGHQGRPRGRPMAGESAR